ncbi:hypothetical protein [Chthonobacter rhizosphaerae]|uniref:hypothetical protein n=1 Tax=Chthonobacter rhizosphaerae TaxID=2735553 RepID=UPI0015EE85CF|nr:hypothetical protein [Chthonobacter rhizosphaerae]
MTSAFATMCAAAIQMVLLLVAANLLGVEEYAKFSLSLAIGIFAAALISEWLRMVLARHAGMRRRRFRRAFLSAVRMATLWTTAAALTLAVLAATVFVCLHDPNTAMFVLASGVVCSGCIILDMASTHVRFTGSQRKYSRFVLLKVIATGATAVSTTILANDGLITAIAFGASSAVYGLVYFRTKWPKDSPFEIAVLKKLAGEGWSLASSSITTGISLTTARLALGSSIEAETAGAIFLAVDLAVRGLNVLGSTLNTWGARLIYDGSHMHGGDGAVEAFGVVSAVFQSIWFSLGLYGVVLSLVLTRLIFVVRAEGDFIVPAIPVLIAVFIHFLRVYLYDVYLSSIRRSSEIAVSSALMALITAVIVATGAARTFQVVAIVLLPCAVFASLTIYGLRNMKVILTAVDVRSSIFSLSKLVTATLGLAIWTTNAGIVYYIVVLILAALLDASQLRYVYQLVSMQKKREQTCK